MDIGVFIPIGNNGWLISTTAPQYRPSFDLNRRIVQKAESYGFDFALSMIKLRGFGGATEYWDHNLESFTLMAGLAAVTDRIRLYASTPILVLPPAMVARMAATIDSIAPGRFGVNIVTGWAPDEYAQMGLWPGETHFRDRYARAAEYVTVLRELWDHGVSNFRGAFYTMDDCVLSPRPLGGAVSLVAAGQSEKGIAFAAEFAEHNFVLGSGVNTPTAFAPTAARLAEASAAAGRDVGTLALFMVIADETEDAALRRWHDYHSHADLEALARLNGQSAADASAAEGSTARSMMVAEGAINLNMGTLVGSYEQVAESLDAIAEVTGTSGIMLVFDDFIRGLDDYGSRIQPLMKCRADRGVRGAEAGR